VPLKVSLDVDLHGNVVMTNDIMRWFWTAITLVAGHDGSMVIIFWDCR